MHERTAWPSMLAIALLVAWAGPATSAAEPPSSLGGATPAAGRPAAATATATVPAATRPSVPVSPDALPSTVSPAIERFLKQSGQNLPPVPPAAVPVMAQAGRSAPPPIPSPGPPASEPRASQGDRGATTAPVTPGIPGVSRPGAMGPSPFAREVRLKPAPLESGDFRFPINLGTALRLSDARPLIVAAAQAGVWVAEAQLTRAKVLWVPMATFGIDFLRHDGGGPDFNKGIMTAPTVNYFEAGPGSMLFVSMTDAYFQPLVQRQILNSRHWDIQTAKNDALMQTADAYFRVHQYRGMYAAALYTVERGRDLVDVVAQLSKELVPVVEVDRARNMLADLEQRAVYDRQEWRVASADLTQVLRLDPRAVVVPMEDDHAQITLIDPGRSLDELMPIALRNRPEIPSRTAQVSAAELAVRREKMRPFLPNVLLGGFQTPAMYTQLGVFGLGPNSSLNQYRLRADVSVQLMWQLEAFGIGNLARIKAQRGQQSRAIIDLRDAQDMVAADVNRALARVQSAAARVLQADRALRTAIITFNGHLEGLGQTRRLENVLVLTFRPQEAVYSLQQMNVSFEEYFTTVAEYNRAQFDLFHALGYPAGEVAALRTPGPVMPVDLARPTFLPPVGHGPPPATR